MPAGMHPPGDRPDGPVLPLWSRPVGGCDGVGDPLAVTDAAGFAALLARVRTGETVWAPNFERDLEQPIAQALPVTPSTRTVVSEGNYLLLPDDPWPQVRAQFDEVWFCRTDPQLRRARLVERHVRFGKPAAVAQAWVSEVDEVNAALVEATLPAADLVVDVG